MVQLLGRKLDPQRRQLGLVLRSTGMMRIHLKPGAAFKSRHGMGELYIELDPADVIATADLLNALDAVPKTQLEAERAAYNDSAERDDILVKKWQARAEAAEEELQNLHNTPWKARYQDERNRAEAAVATLVRVREVADANPNGYWYAIPTGAGDVVRPSDILALIADPEPFVLPTTVPAKVEAVGLIGSQEPHTFTLWSDGETNIWHSDFGTQYVPEMFMEAFKDHRLIGDGDA